MKKAMQGQISIFDLLEEKTDQEVDHYGFVLNPGDQIGRVVLGECRIAIVTKVEGLPNHPFYRTDRGICYTYEDGQNDIGVLQKLAESEREKYKTVLPKNLKNRFTVEYEPRECDGVVLWAQIGIFENMLFWKEACTYQFLEPFANEKELIRAYEKHKKNMTEGSHRIYTEKQEEHKMGRLYWSSHEFYADAEYVQHNN